MKPGDKVWYWARRKSERAHKKYGTVRQTDGTIARVEMDGGMPPVQTVEVKRLNKETTT